MSSDYIQSRAIVADGEGQFILETISVGPPAADEVRVRIKAAGLCHTDWDSIQSWEGPFIVGHEGAGIIDAIGSDVNDFKPGQAVLLNWAIPCGKCSQCMRGNVHICERNSPVTGDGISGHAHAEASLYKGTPIRRSFHLGTLSDYTVVKQEAVTPLNNDTMSYATGAIVGCAVMTGFGSVVNAANVKAGSSTAIIGCGGVGLNVIQACQVAGASKIIAIDISQSRLDQSRNFGATHGILADVADIDFRQVAADLNEIVKDGADYAFECSAVPALGSAPLALIRNSGVAVQVSGIEQRIDFDCELFEWDKIYINPLYGQCHPKRDFAAIQDLHAEKRLKLDELVTQKYTPETVTEGFEDMLAGKLAKGVVMFESDSK